MGNDAGKKKKGNIEKVEPPPPDILPPMIAEQIPEGIRGFMFALISRSGPPSHPLEQVITEEHVQQAITNAENEAKRRLSFAVGGRRFNLTYFIITLIAVGLLIYMFQDKPAILTPIGTAILGFGAGFGVSKKL